MRRTLLPAHRPPGVLARRPQGSALPSVRRRSLAPARALLGSSAAAASPARRAPPPTATLRQPAPPLPPLQHQHQQRRRRRGTTTTTTTAAASASSNGSNDKLYDVVGVSNLCVDVVLPVDALPPPDARARRALLARLQRQPPSLDAWEVGGSCNFMIAAARLGLRVAAVGHTGADPAGRYLEAVLEGEGVGPLLQLARAAAAQGGGGAAAAAGGVVASGPSGSAAALAAALSSSGFEGGGGLDPAHHRALLEEQERLRQQGVLAAAAAAASEAPAASSSSSSSSQSSPEASMADAALADASQTLLCFVLVDPAGGHAFCSAYDFGPWPLLLDALEAAAADRRDGGSGNSNNGRGRSAATTTTIPPTNSASTDQEARDDAAAAERLLPPSVLDALRRTRALYLNGFVFDELPLPLVRALCRAASASGAAVFFDPGPRAHTMREGERRAALDAVLDLADVVLMTEEEAAEVTGQAAGGGADGDAAIASAPAAAAAAAAAEAVLARPGCRTRWAVVKRGPEGAVLVVRADAADDDSDDNAPKPSSSPARPSYLRYASPAVPVSVTDTVGCGDSFAAAAVLGFTRGASPRETLALANAVGAATAMGRGAGTNVASAPRVLGLLEEGQRRGGAEAEEEERGAGAAAGGAIRLLRASVAAAAAPAPAPEEDTGAAAVAAAREEAAAEQQRQQRAAAAAAADCRQQQQQEQSRPARRQPTTAA